MHNLLRWPTVLSGVFLAVCGCIGRPPMQQGSMFYGQPQYVTVPPGAPGPVASPVPFNTTPISAPTPVVTPSIPSVPVATPVNEGISLTPASRMGAWHVPTYQSWRMPTTFAPPISPPGLRYADLGRSIDGRPISYGTGPAESPRSVHSPMPRGFQAEGNGPLPPTPQADLKYRGGWTIRDLHYVNIYVGGRSAWNDGERKQIDWALAGAMTDPHLNHVLMQYFNDQPITATHRGSFLLDGFNPPRVTQGNIREIVKILHARGSFSQLPLKSTAICFLLPKGTILEDPDSGGSYANGPNGGVSPAGDSNSLRGLGGYHGSVHIGAQTVYYAVGVYAERLSNGQTNGIPVFRVPWKDTVAACYHQLQEIRTNPDVDDANVTGQSQSAGWVSEEGEEVADFPVDADSADGRLDQVFVEVNLANGSGKVPVQLCYSNAVHGPEGPIRVPHRGSPLPIPAPLPPPGGSAPPPAPKPQPSPPTADNSDPDLDWIEQEWGDLPYETKLKILNLVKAAQPDAHPEVEEREFGQ